MRITYDATTDVAYLELRALSPGEALGPSLLLEPDPAFRGLVIADVTKVGVLVGLEVVGASGCLPGDVLSAAERIDGGNLAERLSARLAGREGGVEGPRLVH